MNRFSLALALAFVIGLIVVASAQAGPCSRDLPCPSHGAKPPWASECYKVTRNSCWLYSPGWTCNVDSFENGALVVDDDKCSEVFWNPDHMRQLKRHRWRSADRQRDHRHGQTR